MNVLKDEMYMTGNQHFQQQFKIQSDLRQNLDIQAEKYTLLSKQYDNMKVEKYLNATNNY